jgi:hypothetical protein
VIKFGRNYVLQIQSSTDDSKYVSITPPITLEFDIQRNLLSGANNCIFRVYNLSSDTRNQILRDQYIWKGQKQVILQAGYGAGPNFPLVFNGFATKAFSFREGNNFISQIESFDGGSAYLNAIVDGESGQFASGTPYKNIVKSLMLILNAFGVKTGKIGSIPGSCGRGFAVTGSVIEAIISIVGPNSFFIDNGVAHILSINEVLYSNQITLVNADSGLLGTPLRQETLLTFDMIFEPRLSIAQRLQVQSSSGSIYNNVYKVASIKHKGTISGGVCGEAITSVECFYNSLETSV